MFGGFDTQKERETWLLRARTLTPKQVERKKWLESNEGQLSMQFDKLDGERVVLKALEILQNQLRKDYKGPTIDWQTMWKIQAPPSARKWHDSLFQWVSSCILTRTDMPPDKTLVSSISTEAFKMLDMEHIPDRHRIRMMTMFVACNPEEVVKEAMRIRVKMLLEQKSPSLMSLYTLLFEAPQATYERIDMCRAIDKIIDLCMMERQYSSIHVLILGFLNQRIYQDLQNCSYGLPSPWTKNLFRTDQIDNDEIVQGDKNNYDEIGFEDDVPGKKPEPLSWCWISLSREDFRGALHADDLKECVDSVRSTIQICDQPLVEPEETKKEKERWKNIDKLYPLPTTLDYRKLLQRDIDHFNQMLFSNLRNHPRQLEHCLRANIVSPIFDKRVNLDEKERKEIKCRLLETLVMDESKRVRETGFVPMGGGKMYWTGNYVYPGVDLDQVRHDQKLCQCYCDCEKCWLTCCQEFVRSLEPRDESDEPDESCY